MNTPQFDLGAMLSAPQTAIQQIPCDQLHPYHNHKFELYSGERLEDMVASIKENGVLSPIIVQPVEDGYEILIGHNRWNASKLAGLPTVPAIVKTGLTEEEAEMYVIESNVMQRGFENLRIMHGPKDKEHLSLWRLLCSVAPLGKGENVPPNLAGAVMRSILDGTPYPATLLSSSIVRIRAEHDVTYPRAKLVKAFLNHNHERKLTVSLDKNNTDVGYRLGRLFAVLERIQQVANPGINATIRDKFYASASATPAAVFGNLMRLSGHHLSKLDADKKGMRIWLEGLIGEILYRDKEHNGVQKFPPHFTLDEQGMFAIGYYHQRQEFFAGKKATGDDTADTPETSPTEETVQTELSL